MTIFSRLAGGLKVLGKKAEATVRREFSSEVATVRNSISESIASSRNAAANVIAKSAAGVGTRVAGNVGAEGNVYQRLSGFLDMSPDNRKFLVWGMIGLAAVLIVAAKGNK